MFIHQKTYSNIFTVTLFVIAHICTQPKHPSTIHWIINCRLIKQNTTWPQEQETTTTHNMDECHKWRVKEVRHKREHGM